MPKYRLAQVVMDGVSYPVVITDELTAEGFQIYSSAGWLRRTQAWLDVNTLPVDDALVLPLVEELRGRGVELVKQEEVL